MKNYKLTIQYDGTKYNGWQKQKNTKNTIQQKIEDILLKMTGQEIEVFASGRTDSGVHAIAQVINFRLNISKSIQDIKQYLNNYLPMDIKVNEIEEVPLNFHSRLHAKQKTYLYRLNISGKPDVFERKYLYSEALNLDINKIKQATKYLVGEHDFKAFSSIKKTKKSTIRTIYYIDIVKNQDNIDFIFNGNGFLYNMVRILTGTLIDVGLDKIQPVQIKDILDSKDRTNAGKTMPPSGLFLLNVKY